MRKKETLENYLEAIKRAYDCKNFDEIAVIRETLKWILGEK